MTYRKQRREFWLSVCVAAVVCAVLAFATEKHSLDDLKAKIEGAKPDDKVTLCLEVAERQVNAADEMFRKGEAEQAQASLKDVVTYSGQARDAASVTGHRLKNAEIAVRKMAHKLSDMKRQLSFDDQSTVQATIDQLEKIRTDLLDRMFKAGK